jgi:hypothetical protein
MAKFKGGILRWPKASSGVGDIHASSTSVHIKKKKKKEGKSPVVSRSRRRKKGAWDDGRGRSRNTDNTAFFTPGEDVDYEKEMAEQEAENIRAKEATEIASASSSGGKDGLDMSTEKMN